MVEPDIVVSEISVEVETEELLTEVAVPDKVEAGLSFEVDTVELLIK